MLLRSPWLKPRYLVEALGFLFLKLVLLPLPARLISKLGGALARFVGPKLHTHQTAVKNLALAMPELTAKEQEKTLLGMWDNLGRTAFEYACLGRIARNHKRHLKIEIAPKTLALMKEVPCRCVFFSGHFANWELMPLVLTLHQIPSAEIYRPPNNPYANWWVSHLRQKHIAPFQIAKNRRTPRALLRHIKQGRAFGMLLDQIARGGLEAKFFNRPAPTNDVLAVLHLRYGYHLIPASMRRTGPGPNFTLRIFAPITGKATGDYKADALALTQKANDALEEIVRHAPDQWLWVHRRWGRRRTRLAKPTKAG